MSLLAALKNLPLPLEVDEKAVIRKISDSSAIFKDLDSTHEHLKAVIRTTEHRGDHHKDVAKLWDVCTGRASSSVDPPPRAFWPRGCTPSTRFHLSSPIPVAAVLTIQASALLDAAVQKKEFKDVLKAHVETRPLQVPGPTRSPPPKVAATVATPRCPPCRPFWRGQNTSCSGCTVRLTR